jgi:hypothetical protein
LEVRVATRLAVGRVGSSASLEGAASTGSYHAFAPVRATGHGREAIMINVVNEAQRTVCETQMMVARYGPIALCLTQRAKISRTAIDPPSAPDSITLSAS